MIDKIVDGLWGSIEMFIINRLVDSLENISNYIHWTNTTI